MVKPFTSKIHALPMFWAEGDERNGDQCYVIVETWGDVVQVGVQWGEDEQNAKYVDLDRETIDALINSLVDAQARLD